MKNCATKTELIPERRSGKLSKAKSGAAEECAFSKSGARKIRIRAEGDLVEIGDMSEDCPAERRSNPKHGT